MSGVNKVILVGNLGRDPEVRVFESGNAARFSIATSQKNKEGTEFTEWHNISMWGRLADIANQYLKKGDKVYIEGSLRTKKYTDKQGIEKYSTEIVARSMEMLGSQNQTPHSEQVPKAKPEYASKQPESFKMQHASQPQQNQPSIDWDDVPF